MENKKNIILSKNTKIVLLGVLFLSSFVFYGLKLFSLQVVEGSDYRNQSKIISQRSKSIAAQRGEIYDRNASLPMVVNTESFAVDITPGEIPPERFDSITSRLSNFLGISKSVIDKKIPAGMRRSFTPVEIKTNVSVQNLTVIAENITDLPGVSWRSKPIRTYIETGSFSHILGYVGDITKEELKVLYNKGYTNLSSIGKTGIEKQYDEFLQGISGSESRVVDARGRFMPEPPIVVPPQMGKNLVLTIDSRIQQLAEDALGDRIGAAVVLKPTTGEILAMVSYPYFDANSLSTENSGAAYLEIASKQNNPLLNRVVNAIYPPASTFKVVMATAVLAENTLPPDKKIECTGVMNYGDRIFKCHIGVPGHGWVDLKEALAQSCNIYFATAGRDYLGVDTISSYSKEFGLGQSLGLDLPSLADGFIPTALWKERRFHEKWLGGDTMNMSIGQGYTLVTPLHMANMMAMVVNNGIIYKPHLLKEVRDPVSNMVITEVEPEILTESHISESVWKTIRENLRYTSAYGSAQFPLRNKIVQIAGKTGTGEVSQITDSWHSWFVAYAPFDGPPEDAVVVAVLVEAINTWEWWAPYASNIIFQGIFANQNYDEAIAALGFKYLTRPVGRQE